MDELREKKSFSILTSMDTDIIFTMCEGGEGIYYFTISLSKAPFSTFTLNIFWYSYTCASMLELENTRGRLPPGANSVPASCWGELKYGLPSVTQRRGIAPH